MATRATLATRALAEREVADAEMVKDMAAGWVNSSRYCGRAVCVGALGVMCDCYDKQSEEISRC